MSRFNFKSLAFYGVTIGLVLVLFKAVTAYGESTLKAPNNISGIYELTSSNLPNCLNQKNLTLFIEQSGIYIFAKLDLSSQPPKDNNPPLSTGQSKEPGRSTHIDNAQIIHETIKLNGLMQSQPFVLAGKTSGLGGCPNPSDQSPKAIALNLQFLNPPPTAQNLSGTLNWSALSFDFGGKAQETSEPKEKAH